MEKNKYSWNDFPFLQPIGEIEGTGNLTLLGAAQEVLDYKRVPVKETFQGGKYNILWVRDDELNLYCSGHSSYGGQYRDYETLTLVQVIALKNGASNKKSVETFIKFFAYNEEVLDKYKARINEDIEWVYDDTFDTTRRIL